MISFKFEAIGTAWVIDIAKELSVKEEALLLDKIKNRIDIFDKNYSRFRGDSLVMRMSKETGQFVLPDDADKMLMLYKKVYDITSGAVTPLIGQVLVDSGYDADYSLEIKKMTKPLPWEEVLSWDNPKLTVKKPAILDFGAGGKGYLVDIVSDILESEGIESYCVDAGGDMRQRNKDSKVLKIGLENPHDTTTVIGVFDLLDCSLCGSAGNRRKWEDFHHIISPETLSSPKHIESVWVKAETTMLADILTTALFFVPPQILLKHFDFDYLILKPDFSVDKSEGFDVELFVLK